MAHAAPAGRTLTTWLLCQECGQERLHSLLLGPEGFTRTVCNTCGRTVALPHRRSRRLSMGPVALGGGAPVLVHARVPAGRSGAPLAGAVRRLAAAGAHIVELDAQQAEEASARRVVGEAPVALLVNAGDRFAHAFRLVHHPGAGHPGGWAAVRWVYDGDESHLRIILTAASRRRVPLVLAVPALGPTMEGVARILADAACGRPEQGAVVLEFFDQDPARALAAYEHAADAVSCPFHVRLPQGLINEALVPGPLASLGSFLRQRRCDCLSVESGEDPCAGVEAARRLLAQLWLPVAPPVPQVHVHVTAGRRGAVPARGKVLDTLRSAAGVPARVAQGLRRPAGVLPERVFTKPARFWHEVRRDGPGVLLSVPRRLATKPARLVLELMRHEARRT